MHPFEEKRAEARRRLLNRADAISFHGVPNFIINSFFGQCNYKNRLITCTFAYLNGIDAEQLLAMVFWKDIKKQDEAKVKKLYIYFEKPEYQARYYSYNVHTKLVMFLNGDIRKYGVRVPK